MESIVKKTIRNRLFTIPRTEHNQRLIDEYAESFFEVLENVTPESNQKINSEVHEIILEEISSLEEKGYSKEEIEFELVYESHLGIEMDSITFKNIDNYNVCLIVKNKHTKKEILIDSLIFPPRTRNKLNRHQNELMDKMDGLLKNLMDIYIKIVKEEKKERQKQDLLIKKLNSILDNFENSFSGKEIELINEIESIEETIEECDSIYKKISPPNESFEKRLFNIQKILKDLKERRKALEDLKKWVKENGSYETRLALELNHESFVSLAENDYLHKIINELGGEYYIFHGSECDLGDNLPKKEHLEELKRIMEMKYEGTKFPKFPSVRIATLCNNYDDDEDYDYDYDDSNNIVTIIILLEVINPITRKEVTICREKFETEGENNEK